MKNTSFSLILLDYFDIFDILKVTLKKGARYLNQYFTNNDDIRSERRIIKYNYDSVSFSFISDNGVFSKSKIDYGSRLLVDTYIKYNKDKVISNFLDVGSGYGFISILIAKVLNIRGVGIDVNRRALKLAEENAKLNKVDVTFIESDCYKNVSGVYDLVITNPPIRAGKRVVIEILRGASDYMSDKGELWFVIRKDQGAKSVIKEISSLYKIDIVEKNKGFFIIVAKKH